MDFVTRYQEIIALLIVAAAAGLVLRRFYRKSIAPVLSQWLLKRGKVKWAMRVRNNR